VTINGRKKTTSLLDGSFVRHFASQNFNWAIWVVSAKLHMALVDSHDPTVVILESILVIMAIA
jgi:hypothetical protein